MGAAVAAATLGWGGKMRGSERKKDLPAYFSSGGEKLLAFAEALLKKHISSHSLHEPEALSLYVSILEQQAKYDAALEVLSGDLGSLMGREEDKLRLQRGRGRPNLTMGGSEGLEYHQRFSHGQVESRLASALLFVQKLQKNDSSDSVRGPHLANIEIERQHRLSGNSTKFMEALVNYFHRYVAVADYYLYERNRIWEVSILAIYNPLFWRTRNLGYLLEAVLVLEFGLTVRKHVWQYKITLVHLYSYLGALPLAHRWHYWFLFVSSRLFDETRVSSIYPDLYSCIQMLSSPFLQQTASLVKDYLRFMDDHLKESADLTCLAYRHRTYSKVIEFVQFKNRLQRSMQYLAVKSDSVILSLKQKSESLEEVEVYRAQFKNLTNQEPIDESSTPACFRAEVCKHKSTEKDGPKMRDAERKCLVPQLVYLSMHGCVSSLRETEPNGSVSDITVGEMKTLLEKYARTIGYSMDDALSMILGISSGKKSMKDFAPDIVSWMSFAVFINAMNLWSNESVIPRTDPSSPSSWEIVDSLVKICIEEHLTDANRILTCPGNKIPLLVQMVTEPISWHLIIIQSCMRVVAPQGKKKKKSGPSLRPNMPQLQGIQRSVQCLIETLRSVQKWLSDQMSLEEQGLDILMSYLQGTGDEGPGQTFRVLEEKPAAHASELGDRIAQSLEAWSSTGVVRRIVGAEHEVLAEFKKMVDSKLKLLMSESASLSSVLH
uniref:Uncharacterized protein n=1 Tax=Aegilops tauschii TaxID=37682 RepID=M8D7I3_AEGTA